MKILYDGKNSAENHMEKDRSLFSTFSEPVLRFYEFHPKAITYGYFIDPKKHLKENVTHYFDLAKRPTGGGILFHEADFSFSLFIPRTDARFSEDIVKNYHWINSCVLKVMQRRYPDLSLFEMETEDSNFCMGAKSSCDLLLGQKKVGAAAQRISKRGFLHECSLFVSEPVWDDIRKVVQDEASFLSMHETSGAVHVPATAFSDLALEISEEFSLRHLVHLVK